MKEWSILPDGDLAQKENWLKHRDDRYAALRLHLLLVKTEDRSKGRPGPVVAEVPVPPNDKITLRHRYEEVRSQMHAIAAAIKFTTSSRLMLGVASKVQSEISQEALGFSGKLGLDLSGSYEAELIEGLSGTLEQTRSFELEVSQEREQIIELNGAGQSRTANLRKIFWPHYWDVYLYSYDYLELTYKSRFIPWWQVRETIKQVSPVAIKLPLFRIVFYEPQQEVAVYYGPVDNELTEPAAIEVHPVERPAPSCPLPKLESLEELAKLAFPVSRQERQAAESRKVAGKRAAKKPAAKKKAAAKKATAKKRTAKKATAKKRAPKKAGKKRATRKAPKKRTATRAARR